MSPLNEHWALSSHCVTKQPLTGITRVRAGDMNSGRWVTSPCSVFMPNKCVPCIQSSEHPILPCADTGLLRHETFSYCHNHSGCRHSVSIVNSNICSKYYPYHKTLASHLCSRPPALGWSVRLPHLWSGAHPGGAGGALHSGDIITIIIISSSVSSYLYSQELDFLTKVSLSVLRSPDPRLRARIGGGLDQAPRNRWEVSVTIIITCL